MSTVKNVLISIFFLFLAKVYFCALLPLGLGKRFFLYGANPKKLSEGQLRHDPVILLHGEMHNPTAWVPLLRTLRKRGYLGPIYTVKYTKKERVEALRKKIWEVAHQYKKEIEITLIGHSLGQITAMEYLLEEKRWIAGVKIKQMISISGRMKDEGIRIFGKVMEWPFEALKPSLQKIEEYLEKLTVPLYMVGGDHDWLVPQSAIFVKGGQDQQFRARNRGHFSILFHRPALNKIHEWLSYTQAD